MLLTRQELEDLTGYVRSCYQIKWLRENGYTFRLAADGTPRVEHEHHMLMMGCVQAEVKARKRAPNFSAMTDCATEKG